MWLSQSSEKDLTTKSFLLEQVDARKERLCHTIKEYLKKEKENHDSYKINMYQRF